MMGKPRARAGPRRGTSDRSSLASPIVLHLGDLTADLGGPKSKLAYLAGLIDGDGSIYLAKHGLRAYAYMYPIAEVHSTDLGVLKWVKRYFGGYISPSHTSRDMRRKRPVWQWRVRGPKALAIIKAMMPYLIIKWEKALSVLDFCTPGAHGLPPGIREIELMYSHGHLTRKKAIAILRRAGYRDVIIDVMLLRGVR